jgi:predicted chitinase
MTTPLLERLRDPLKVVGMTTRMKAAERIAELEAECAAISRINEKLRRKVAELEAEVKVGIMVEQNLTAENARLQAEVARLQQQSDAGNLPIKGDGAPCESERANVTLFIGQGYVHKCPRLSGGSCSCTAYCLTYWNAQEKKS